MSSRKSQPAPWSPATSSSWRRATWRRPTPPWKKLRPGRHVLASGLWQRAVGLGALVCALSLAAGGWARTSGRAWQTVLFLALLGAQLGVVLGLRERLLTRANPALPAAVLVSALLGAAAVWLPFLRDLLETAPLGWADLGAPALAAVAGFFAARAFGRERTVPHGQG